MPPPLQSHPFISGVDGVGSGVPDIDSAIDVVAWVTWESDQPSKVADPAMVKFDSKSLKREQLSSFFLFFCFVVFVFVFSFLCGFQFSSYLFD